ncbi:fimbrial protein, partial [Escherichia coli]|nr:fimbrial protein [Escherichia coli]
ISYFKIHLLSGISGGQLTNLKEVAAKSKLTDTTVSIPITASYYVYDTNKVKSGALEATALINVKYD